MAAPHDGTALQELRLLEPWATYANHWAKIGSPLRPCPEDLQRLQAAWLETLPAGRPARRLDVLLLGVTPELALFPWADEVNLVALDANENMVRTVWPGNAPHRQAVLGHWEEMPFPDASFDLIVNDSGLAVIPELARLNAIGGELQRLLRAGGRVVMRHLTSVTSGGTLPSLARDVASGHLRNFDGLRLRLLLALDATSAGQGIRLGDAWETFTQQFPDRVELARLLDCDLSTIAMIDAYRGRAERYHFRSLPELAQAFPAFHLALGPAGHYPFAEYCPVFSLAPRQ